MLDRQAVAIGTAGCLDIQLASGMWIQVFRLRNWSAGLLVWAPPEGFYSIAASGALGQLPMCQVVCLSNTGRLTQDFDAGLEWRRLITPYGSARVGHVMVGLKSIASKVRCRLAGSAADSPNLHTISVQSPEIEFQVQLNCSTARLFNGRLALGPLS